MVEGKESGVLRLPFQNRVHYVFMEEMNSAFEQALVLKDLEWNLRRKCDVFSEFGRDFYCRIQRCRSRGRENKVKFTCWSRSTKCSTKTNKKQTHCRHCNPPSSRQPRKSRRQRSGPRTATCIQLDSTDTAQLSSFQHRTLLSADMARLTLEPTLDAE